MHDVFKRGMTSLKNKLIILSIIKLVRALKESKGDALNEKIKFFDSNTIIFFTDC